ncbi:MAG: TlpA family protein disulfide reductase [Candidatus Rokubacteria bacterium]|nr:TlpA family protein disulfide reductase [Candidatus Rokubacteria bacterium]
MPSTIQEIHRDDEARGLRVVAVSIKEPRATVSAWTEKQKVTFPIGLDSLGGVAATYGIRATPTVILVSRDGTLLAGAAGTKPWTSDKGRTLIESLLEAGG